MSTIIFFSEIQNVKPFKELNMLISYLMKIYDGIFYICLTVYTPYQILLNMHYRNYLSNVFCIHISIL